jgi:plasmid stabilization system protein ParE
MYQLIVTSEARSDIDRNADWWAEHHSIEQSIAWTKAIYQQLESLRHSPESHTLSLENDVFDFEIREKLVGFGSRPRFRAVFAIKQDKVYVLTVRAAEQDRLSPDDVDLDLE